MKCPNCRADNIATARFCRNCGTQLKAPPSIARPTRRRRWPFVLLVVVFIAMAGAAAVFLLDLPIPALPSVIAVPGPDRILYAIQDNGLNTLVNTLAVINPDGSDSLELIHSRDGFWMGNTAYSDDYLLSPNRQWLSLYESTDDGWELVLASVDGGVPLLSDDRALLWGGVRTSGFSPDGERFAYTTFEEASEEINLYVLDEAGGELLSMPGLVFGDFFHDHRYLLVVETDEEGLFAALARLDVDTGNLERIADLSDSSGWVRPAIGPNDERVYYYADRALVAVDVDGGEAEQVHEFESHRSAAFFAANAQTLVIYDQPEGGSLGELRLLEPEDNRSIRIDRDVNLSTTSVHVGARGIAFSDNGKLVAYCSGQAGELGLYVIGRDGSDRRRLSNDNLWITFGFSPNSRKIAYIEGEDLREPGTLYVANVDGSERVRLDAEVWSFQFTQNGRHLVYSKVYDLEQNEPQSELYRISLNGKDQELISRSVDGLITLLPRPD